MKFLTNLKLYSKHYFSYNNKINMFTVKQLLSNLKENNKKGYSIELCSTKDVPFNLLSAINPLFYSVTWHQTHSVNKTENPAMPMAIKLANDGKNVLLHLPCKYLSKQNVFEVLEQAKQNDIRNIFALQGDPMPGHNSIDFEYAVDLVRFIKKNFGDYFCICVAGYPFVHPDAASEALDLSNLKQKINAGADCIITQMIFKTEQFYDFYKKCRDTGINVPIMPGLYFINSYHTLMNLSKICHVRVPQTVLSLFESIKNDEVALRNNGLKHARELINNLFSNEMYPIEAIHLFSLNNIDNMITLTDNFNCFQR